MPEWLPPVLIFAGVLVGFVGSMIGHRLTAGKQKTDLQLALIDQLQEERNRMDEKMEKQEQRHADDVSQLNKRITGFYADKSKSRHYIAALESHIYQGNPPPPPDPPHGYIP